MRKRRLSGRQQIRGRRRGAIIVAVAVSLIAIMGFVALSIDVGHIYNVKAELQRTADAAALAAVAELSKGGSDTAAMESARQTASQYAAINQVLSAPLLLDDTDITFGRAYVSSGDGKYTFETTQVAPNAVRVRARRTTDSPSGPVPLFFARALGIATADVSAQATAVVIPRDICFVLDLSGSLHYDSALRSVKKIDIGNRKVWTYLKDQELALAPQTDGLGFESVVSVRDNGDGTSRVTITLTSDADAGTAALSHLTLGLPNEALAMAEATATSGGGYPVSVGTDPTTGVTGLKFDETSLGEDGQQQSEIFSFSIPNECLNALMTVATKAGTGSDTSVRYNLSQGPLLGNMRVWGNNVTGPSWDCTTDPGLVKLQKGVNWTLTSAFASQTLSAKGYGAYNAAEMTVINSSARDSDSAAYKRRVRVALGLDRWKSGKSGGQAGGNGDNVIDASEVVPMIPYPNQSRNPDTFCKQVGGSWDAYINYVISSSSSMCSYEPGSDLYGDPNLRYRFGLKTWIDYVQDQELGDAASPGLGGAPTQPMGAVADAVKECITIIQSLESSDKAGMASYGTIGYGPAEKPDNMSWLVNDLESIRAKVDKLQPAMWSNYTNIAQGIDKGVEVLFDSPDARANAAKIMLLLTDGNANYTRNPASYNLVTAPLDAKAAAQDARDRGVRIYTITVGSSADTNLMQEIAAIGDGESFHAEGSIETYQAQLKTIFQKLGGKQPIALIE